MRAAKRLVVAVVAVALLPGRGNAQRQATSTPLDPVRIGPHIGYNFDADALNLGLQVTMPLVCEIVPCVVRVASAFMVP